MYLNEVSEKIYEGIKIIKDHFIKNKEVLKDYILYLKEDEISENNIQLQTNSSFFKETIFNKFYNHNLKDLELHYGDILYSKPTEQIITISKLPEYRIIASEDFLVIRPNSYLKQLLNNSNYYKYLNNELVKIYTDEYPNKIELVKKIFLPKNYAELENILFERPDKRKVDLSKINIKQGLMTLDKVMKRILQNEIKIETSTYFQRKGGLWSDEVKSRFIEALIVKQPVPAFYFDATNEDEWLIVDGLQRLSAVKQFVLDKENPLRLTGLYYLSDNEYFNKTFGELPRSAQRNIEEYEIIAYKIEAPTPKEVKYKIFKSINESPLILSDQEIRHALNQRTENDTISPAEYVEEFSNNSIFTTIMQNNNKTSDRMEDREIVLRYLAFRLTKYENYSPSMTEFLDDAMTKLYRISANDLERYKYDFEQSLTVMNEIFGQDAYRKRMYGLPEENFINNLFEAWTYIFAILNDENRRKVLSKKNKIKEMVKLLINDEKYINSIDAKSPYTKENLRYRFNKINQFISNYIK